MEKEDQACSIGRRRNPKGPLQWPKGFLKMIYAPQARRTVTKRSYTYSTQFLTLLPQVPVMHHLPLDGNVVERPARDAREAKMPVLVFRSSYFVLRPRDEVWQHPRKWHGRRLPCIQQVPYYLRPNSCFES